MGAVTQKTNKHMYMYMNMCMCTCMCAWMCMCIYIYIYIYIYMCVCVCVCLCISVCVCICICVCVCVYIYIFIYIGVWNSYNGDCEENCILWCDDVQCGICLPTFQRTLLPLLSVSGGLTIIIHLLDYRDIRFLWNVAVYLPEYTVSHYTVIFKTMYSYCFKFPQEEQVRWRTYERVVY